MTDKWEPLTLEQLRKLRHHPAVVAKITELANKLCANANAIARDTRSFEKHRTDKQKAKAAADQFAVVVQNDPSKERPRAYVRPVGRTGLQVEMGESVLFKALATMGGQAATGGVHHPRHGSDPGPEPMSIDLSKS